MTLPHDTQSQLPRGRQELPDSLSDLQIRLCNAADAAPLAAFVKAHPYGQIAHTWEGIRLAALASGGRWSSHLLLALRGGAIVGVMPWAAARFRGMPLPVCRSVGGPLVSEPEGGGIAQRLLGDLLERGKRAGCWRAETSLGIPYTIDGERFQEASVLAEACRSQGFRREVPVAGTYWVPLRRSDDDLIASVAAGLRRKIRKGLREGVTVQVHSDYDSLLSFMESYGQMLTRKGARGQSRTYLVEGVWPCIQAGLASIYASYYQGEVCNFAIVTLPGRPRYWLGASSPATRRPGMPYTGQVLHYEILRSLRDLGNDFYDLGGAEGPVPQREHPNYGVWHFKYEFNGRYVIMLGDYGRPIRPLGDAIIRSGIRLLRSSRSLTRRAPRRALPPGAIPEGISPQAGGD